MELGHLLEVDVHEPLGWTRKGELGVRSSAWSEGGLVQTALTSLKLLRWIQPSAGPPRRCEACRQPREG